MRIGDRATRRTYRAVVVASYVTIVVGVLVEVAEPSLGLTRWGLVALASWPIAIRPVERAGTATGAALMPVLVGTATLHAAFGATLTLGLLLGRSV